MTINLVHWFQLPFIGMCDLKSIYMNHLWAFTIWWWPMTIWIGKTRKLLQTDTKKTFRGQIFLVVLVNFWKPINVENDTSTFTLSWRGSVTSNLTLWHGPYGFFLKIFASLFQLFSSLFVLKGDAKKMSQTLLTLTNFRLQFTHFLLIGQKIDTISFLMSYCMPL